MHDLRMPRRHLLVTAAGLWPVFRSARAEAWPAKPIRLINPFPAGGGLDAFARPLAAKLTGALGKQVFVENLSGAGGTVGASQAAKAAPDGYTFMLGAVHHAIAESLYPKLSYRLDRDFVPVAMIASVPNVLVTHPSRPWRNVRDVIERAKSQPGKLNFASAGNGTSHHLAVELFRTLSQIQVNHVPYRGAAPALQDVIAGQTDLMFDGLANCLPHIQSGRLTPLAVTSPKRASTLPQLPTVSESGLPGFEVQTWYALWAVNGTPLGAIDRIAVEVKRALDLPDLRASWAAQGAEGEPLLLKEFSEFQTAELRKWAKVVKDSGARIE